MPMTEKLKEALSDVPRPCCRLAPPRPAAAWLARSVWRGRYALVLLAAVVTFVVRAGNEARGMTHDHRIVPPPRATPGGNKRIIRSSSRLVLSLCGWLLSSRCLPCVAKLKRAGGGRPGASADDEGTARREGREGAAPRGPDAVGAERQRGYGDPASGAVSRDFCVIVNSPAGVCITIGLSLSSFWLTGRARTLL